MGFTINHMVMFSQALLIVILLLLSLSVLLLNGEPFVSGGSVSISTKVLFVIVLAATLFIGIRRDTYLPFLGVSVLPPELVKEMHTPDGATVAVDVAVNAPNGSKIVYWAANPVSTKQAVSDPMTAYRGYKNAGVAMVRDGKAVLKINCPAEYNVAHRQLKKHVHYRICNETGLMGPIETAFVVC